MGHQNGPVVDSRPSEWFEGVASAREEPELARLNAIRTKAADETAAAIARELNGPLTALLLYMGEIKHHSDQLSPASGDRAYLQRVVENALAQTERVCTLVKELAGSSKNGVGLQSLNDDTDAKVPRVSPAAPAHPASQKRLTRSVP